MTENAPLGDNAADEAMLDDTDEAILAQIRHVYGLADPPPAELNERVRFAIALDNIDVEVSRLAADLMVGSGARDPERTRTITFDCESLTIMVSIVDISGDRVRLDGWLAPSAALQVELRNADAPTLVVTSDVTGRFVFDSVRRGIAQILVRLARANTTVVTPSLIL